MPSHDPQAIVVHDWTIEKWAGKMESCERCAGIQIISANCTVGAGLENDLIADNWRSQYVRAVARVMICADLAAAGLPLPK
jgi:hypothetical protein